jgi:hypothetical protein
MLSVPRQGIVLRPDPFSENPLMPPVVRYGKVAVLPSIRCRNNPKFGTLPLKSPKETDMSGHLLITSAIMLAIAGPAFADCNQEIQSLGEAVTQAETGASANAALPATPHQEEVLAGSQQGGEAGPGDAGKADVPESPHQQQVLAGTQTGERGGQQPADLIAEARDMAKAGDEEGCMQKVVQAKDLLGID